MRALLFFILATLISVDAAYADIVIITNNPAPLDTSSQRLVSAMPYDDQTVDQGFNTITMTFSQGIRADRSFIKVFSPYNMPVNDGKVTVNGTTMTAALPPLQPGKYRFKWQAACTCPDNSEIDDIFHFTVK